MGPALPAPGRLPHRPDPTSASPQGAGDAAVADAVGNPAAGVGVFTDPWLPPESVSPPTPPSHPAYRLFSRLFRKPLGTVLGLLGLLLLLVLPGEAMAQCGEPETFTSSGTWTVPAGVTSITVEAWGGGGRGGHRTSGTASYGGGGGGAYSRRVISVTPGHSYAYVVGLGSNSTAAGGSSRFYQTFPAPPGPDLVLALGGNSAGNNSPTGATGGAAASGVGDVKYSGGNGATSTSSASGGGGSSASPTSHGTPGSVTAGGTITGGGNGGNGTSALLGGDGAAGQDPGGGGGGGKRTILGGGSGGRGGDGQIRITYTITPPTAGTIAGAQTVCSGGDPVAFTSTTAGTGGSSYRWESAVSPFDSWSPIAGATGATYDAPPGLTVTTQYRRRTVASPTCESVPTAPIQVTVQSLPTAGAIAGVQAVCSGGDPAGFTSTTAGTGTGTISYRWESAVSPFDSWSPIADATGATYDAPSGLTVTTRYRRRTVATGSVVCESVPTAPIEVTISPNKSADVPTAATVCAVTGTVNMVHNTTSVTGIGTATGLPTGVTASFSLVNNTITISGAPTQLGTFNYSIPLDGCGPAANATGTIMVNNCACEEIYTSDGSFTVPAGVTSITVEAWGGGGRGATMSSSGRGGGGGGGAYSRSVISVTPGHSYAYVVGLGSNSATAGGSSRFYQTFPAPPGPDLVLALGGNSAGNNSTNGATGGAAGPGVGNVKFSGGNGANSSSSIFGTTGSGGGGSSASPTSNGTPGSVTAGGTITGGGNGGNGTDTNGTPGQGGFSPGGGGGGARRNSGTVNGGTGGDGQIKITYTISAGTLGGNQPVQLCEETTTTLTSTVPDGIWSSSNDDVATVTGLDEFTGIVTGVAPGSAVISYSIPVLGCGIATATRTVIVSESLKGTLNGIDELCVDGTFQFSSTATNGTWSSSNDGVAKVSPTGLVTAMGQGMATILYTLPPSGGCLSSVLEHAIEVFDPPSAGTLSGDPVCVGGTSTFSSTASGGTWSSSDDLIATIDFESGEIFGVAPGSATMTYTVVGTGGCADATATRDVTVTAAPDAGILSGTPELCVGGEFFFSSTTSGGTWSSDDDLIATVDPATGLVTGVAVGDATLTYTVPGSGGCGNATATLPVTVRALPTPTFTAQAAAEVCLDEPVTYTTEPDMLIYAWIFPGDEDDDYEIISGGGESDHSVTLVWKSTGSKQVGINYLNPNNCAAVAWVFSDASEVLPNTSLVSESLAGQASCDGEDDFSPISVTASGPGTFHYQWYKTPFLSTSGGAPVGTDDPAYTPSQDDFLFNGIGDENPLYYYVVVSQEDGCGDPVTSSVSGAFVIKEFIEITSDLDPDDDQVECFEDGFDPISVTATGSPLTGESDLTYQWYSNTTQDNSGGTPVPGANAAEFTPPSNTAYFVPYYYYVVVTGYCESKTSAVSGEFIVTPPATTITVDLDPDVDDKVHCFDGDYTFPELSVLAIGEGDVTYKWYRNDSPENTGGTEIPGETEATFTPQADVAGTWYYYARASSDCGTVPSSVSGKYVVNPLTEIDEEHLNGQTICEGEAFDPIFISVEAIGEDLSYQWYSNTSPSTVGATEVGDDSPSYQPSPSLAGPMYYYVVVNSHCGPVVTSGFSGAFVVTPNMGVTDVAADQTVCINAALGPVITHTTTLATGIANDGVPGANGLPPGVFATWAGDNITLSGTPTSAAGSPYTYSIPLTGGCGTETATGTITVTPDMGVSSAAPDQTVCINEELLPVITHTTTLATGIADDGVPGANGLPPGVSATWAGGNITISGEATASGTFAYSIPLSGGCGTVAATGTITVHPKPAIDDLAYPGGPVCPGEEFSFVPIDGTHGLVPDGTTYSWSIPSMGPGVSGGTSGTGASSITGTLSNSSDVPGTATYTVIPTSGLCTGDPFTLTVTVKPTPTVNPVPNQAPVCSGSPSTAVNFGGNMDEPDVEYHWTNSHPSIGLPASGTGDILSFITENTGSAPITATITVTPVANGCPGPAQEFTITVNPTPIVTVIPDYCAPGGNVELVATSSVPVTWAWNTPHVPSFGTTSSVFVDIAGIYTVTATSPDGCVTSHTFPVAQELVVNGDFTGGYINSETGLPYFTTGYAYHADDPSRNNELVPDNANNGFGVGTNGQNYHTNFWGVDHTNNAVGPRNMMIVNGHDDITVWQQTVNVRPHSEYYFSAWAMSVNNVGPLVNPLARFARLQFEVNGVLVGTVAALGPGPSNATQAANSDDYWTRFHSGDNPWYSGDYEGPITIRIVNLEEATTGNDFALDDISFGTLSTFVTLSSGVGTDEQVVCQDTPIDDITYSVGGGITGPVVMGLPPGVTTNWNGVTLRFSGEPTAAGTYPYTVVTTGAGDCLQASATGTITVRATPTAGEIAGEQTLCDGGDLAELTSVTPGTGDAGADITYRWESNTDLTTPVWTIIPDEESATYTPSVSETTQYRRVTIATLDGLSCYSEPTAPVTITVQAPVTPGEIAGDQTICEGGILAAFTSIDDGDGDLDGDISYIWEYTNVSTPDWTVIPDEESATYTPPVVSETTQYRRITVSTLNGVACESAPTNTVEVVITPDVVVIPEDPDQNLCVNVELDPPIIIHNTTGATGIVPESAGVVDYNLPNGVIATWTAGALPGAGIISISGTPTEQGTFNYSIPLEGCGSATATGTIFVDNPSYPITGINVVNPPTGAPTPATSTFTVYSPGLTTGTYQIHYSTDGINEGPDQTISVEVITPGQFTFTSPSYSNQGTTVLTINWIQKTAPDADLCRYYPPNNNTAPYGIGCTAEFSKAGGAEDTFYVPANISEVTIQVFGNGAGGNTASATIPVAPGGVIFVVFDGDDVFATEVPPSASMADRLAGAFVSTTGPNGRIVFHFECDPLPPCAGLPPYEYTDSEGYTVLRFDVGACDWYAPDGLEEFEVLVVGGGGGGGFGGAAGGGGGGAVVYQHYRGISTGGVPGLQGAVFSLSVGVHGQGAPSAATQGGTGGGSTFTGPAFASVQGEFLGLAAGGGGGGGSTSTNPSIRPGAPGASGGGGAASGTEESAGGAGSAGSSGGTGYGEASGTGGGGGGGASGAGGAAAFAGSMNGGAGGDGRLLAISGEEIHYGAGGGGTSSGAVTNQAGVGGSLYEGPGGVNYYAGGSASNHDVGQSPTTFGSGGGAGRDGGGSGFPGVIYVRYANFSILPVEYLYFHAKYNPGFHSGDLTWATAKEWENRHFEVERSVNDVKSWETIGQVDGAGYSDQPVDYAYRDTKLPLAGGNIFYRLKQVDFDGDSAYSVTRSIQVAPMAGTSYWRVYPNPTTGDPISLELLDDGVYNDEAVTVRIISATGQFDLVESTAGTTLNALVADRLRGKAAGLYTLEITWSDKREYHKVVLRR